MRLIINAEPSDFILAVRAAMAAMERNERSTIICYENGSKFLVRQTKGGWSVTADNMNPGFACDWYPNLARILKSRHWADGATTGEEIRTALLDDTSEAIDRTLVVGEPKRKKPPPTP